MMEIVLKQFSLFVALLCLQARRGHSELVAYPRDTEVLVNNSAYFNCSTSIHSEQIHWHHYRVGENQANHLFNGREFNPTYVNRYSIEINIETGAYNLIIRGAQPRDAGRYVCQDDGGRGKQSPAELIVLDKLPICQSSQNTNEVIGTNTCSIPLGELQLTCSTTYHGDAAPVLQWFQDGSDQPVAEGTTFSSFGNRVQSNLTLKADSIKNGSYFHCRTTRSKATPYDCTSGSVKIIGSHYEICPSTKPYADAILVICLFLIPIIIAASVVGGIYLEKRFKIGLFDRLVKGKEDKPLDLHVQADPTAEENVAQKTGATEDVERLMLLENNAKSQEQQNELLKKRILELAKSSDEDNRKIVQLEKKARQLEEETSKLEEEKRKLEEEYSKVEEEKHELEERLYPSAIASYSDQPKLVSIIEMKTMKAGSKKKMIPIFGMTILHNKLFVVTEKGSEIEVYDSVTFNSEPTWKIAEMSNPVDVASCRTNNCLYVFNGEPNNAILRVDSSKTVLKMWSFEKDLGHLSVTRDGNVIVSLFNGNKIIEYSSDGKLIRTVRLWPADNIHHPWHAIKATGKYFLFSHGIGEDRWQRVCVANADGKILKSFGGKKASDSKGVNRPVHLLEDSSRNILVADMKNGRVLLLNPKLEYKRILVSGDQSKLRFPMRLCVDEERGILFVADNHYKTKKDAFTYDDGRILIFNCKA